MSEAIRHSRNLASATRSRARGWDWTGPPSSDFAQENNDQAALDAIIREAMQVIKNTNRSSGSSQESRP